MFSHLLSPIRLGAIELPNRIVSTAHQTTLVHEHVPTDHFVAYHEARGRGGVGLIVLEATAVDPSGLLTSHTLGGYLPEIVDGYRRVAAAVQPHSTRLFVQLFHGGREQIASAPRAPALAPSAIPSPRFRTEPRAARSDELERIIDGYARSAELAEAGGLDGVEISAAHRYLIEQFFDPQVNRRQDAWGDGRDFLVAVLRAVRQAAPGLGVGVRVSGDSRAGLAIAEVAAGEGVDYVSVALGESSSYLGSVGIVPPAPVEEDVVAERARGYRLGPALIATSRIVDPVHADQLIARGVVDAVGMTRALIADPELPEKARSGRGDRILRCIGCNACIAHYHAGTEIACAVNPRTGRERRLPPAGRISRARRVVVVGGGPAGLAGAVEAAEAGSSVVLFERSPRLGGQMSLTATATGTSEIGSRLVALFEGRLADIDVRLATEAHVDQVRRLEPDAVLVAAGARPYVPDLPLAGLEVVQSWDVLVDPPRGRRVVVADWGGDPSGLDAAEVLTAAGNQVTLAIASVTVGEGVHQYRRNLYLQRLYRSGVEFVQHHSLASASEDGVELSNVFAPELRTTIAADLLVLAQGRVPEDTLAPALRDAGLVVEEAGDCLSPRSFEEAILEGTLAVHRLLGLA